jgi:citrate lyase subunit beta/citryl-CoA lyase
MNDLAKRLRSFLFVPADRPERFPKALSSGAQAVIVDLEDAVAPSDKPRARECFADALKPVADRSRVFVRINGAGTEWHDADVAFLATLSPPIGGIFLPKAEDRACAERVAQRSKLPVIAMIESAEGLHAIDAVATAPGVVRLAFGHLDFQVDVGMQASEDERELDSVRLAIVMASRRANLAPPVDGVTVALDDEARLKADLERGKRLGLRGKLCIHPKQVRLANDIFAPTEAQLDWARRVVEAAKTQGGAFRIDGKMVDAPVIAQARALLYAA